MLQKKAVVLFGLLGVVLLVVHLVMGVSLFLGAASWSRVIPVTGRVLVTCLAVHVVFALAGFVRDRRSTWGQASYPSLAVVDTVQVVSGISVVLLALVHGILGEASFQAGTALLRWGYFAANALLFVAVGIHLGIALPHVLVSLGVVVRPESYRRAKRWAVVICSCLVALLLVADVVLVTRGW